MTQIFSIVKFKFLVTVTIFLLLNSCSKSGTGNGNDDTDPVPDLPGWDLVWHDEFEGDGIDMSKWEHEVNAWGGGNNELQYYTNRPENSYISDGKLVIKALDETFTGPEGTREYTSARLRTMEKGDWKYGRFEIRARLPFGQGIWPAIWMLPTDWAYGGWAASGEIDIMELLGQEPHKVHGTLHYGGEWPDNVHTGTSYTLKNGDFSQDFHLFALEWDTTEIRWFVDSLHYQTQTQWHSDNAPYPAPFDKRFHILLNVAVGGNWPGDPDETTGFPQTMEVDYVRVYKKTKTVSSWQSAKSIY
jgi:beta-glucanase (GH16 family)